MADQGQVDAGGVAQVQEALEAPGGEPMGAQHGQPGSGQGTDPGGGGLPRGLLVCGEAARQQGRLALGCQEVVDESGVTGCARPLGAG